MLHKKLEKSLNAILETIKNRFYYETIILNFTKPKGILLKYEVCFTKQIPHQNLNR